MNTRVWLAMGSTVARFLVVFFVLLAVIITSDMHNYGASAARNGKVNSGDEDLDDWNSNINWVQWPQAIEKATAENKPIFLLIHKSWCPACKSLRRKFVQSAEIDALSVNFVMVHTSDDDEPEEEKYAPQGQYYPRLLFLKPDGSVSGVWNSAGLADHTHMHHYQSPEDIVRGMLTALHAISGIKDVDEM